MNNFKNIDFIPLISISEDFYPIPASKNIPEWYKKQKSYLDKNRPYVIEGTPNSTIKKCIPFFDSMTAGYILRTHTDIYVSFDQNGSNFSSLNNKSAQNVIGFHSNLQAETYPDSNMMPYPKFINPWAIKTSKGYSTLFIPPMNNPNKIFNIFPGIVDTDSYYNSVNFPFILNDPTFEGIIPAGTPICQVIPFKRDKFKMNVKEGKKNIKLIAEFQEKYLVKFFNNYKNRYWHKKVYR